MSGLGEQRWVAILSRKAKLIFGQRLEGAERISHVNICGYTGKSVRGRRNSMCKDLNRECNWLIWGISSRPN